MAAPSPMARYFPDRKLKKDMSPNDPQVAAVEPASERLGAIFDDGPARHELEDLRHVAEIPEHVDGDDGVQARAFRPEDPGQRDNGPRDRHR